MEELTDPMAAIERLDEVRSVLAVESGDDRTPSEVRAAATNARLAAGAEPETAAEHLDVVDERLQAALERATPDEPADSLSGDDQAVVRTQIELMRTFLEVGREDPDLLGDDVEGIVAATEEGSPDVRYLGSLLQLVLSSKISGAMSKSSTTIVRDAKGELESIPEEHPDAVAPHVAEVFTAMEVADTDRLAGGCVMGLGAVAAADADAVADHVEDVVAAIEDLDDAAARETCAVALQHVAEGRPDAVVPHVEELLALVDPISVTDDNVAYAETVQKVAEERPDEVAPYIDSVLENLEADSMDVVEASALTLRGVARGRPDAVVDHVDDLVASLEDADVRDTSEPCAEPLVTLAEERPDVMADYTGTFIDMLEADPESGTCFDVARVIEAIANNRPEAVSARMSDVVDALDRANLPWDSDIQERITDTLTEGGSDTVVLEAIETAESNGACSGPLETVASEHPDALASQSEHVIRALGVADDVHEACADAFRGLVDDHQEVIPVDELTAAEPPLDSEEAARDVSEALQAVVAARPDAVAQHVDTLFTALDEIYHSWAREDIRNVLVAVADERPDAVAKGAVDRLADNDACANMLLTIAEDHPDLLVDDVDDIVGILDSDDLETIDAACEEPLRRVIENHPDHFSIEDLVHTSPAASQEGAHATVSAVLREIAREDPSTVAQHTDALFDALADSAHDARENLAETVQMIANERPETVAERTIDVVEADYASGSALRVVASGNGEVMVRHTDDLISAFGEVDRDEANAACADLLRTIAGENPEAVASTAASMLTARRATHASDITGAVGATLREVAEANPEEISPYIEQLVGALLAKQAGTTRVTLYQCQNGNCSAVFASGQNTCSACGEQYLTELGVAELQTE